MSVKGGRPGRGTSSADAIPQELRDRPQWVLWKFEPDQDGRPTKVPYTIKGPKADSTDPATWSSFRLAHDALLRLDGYTGLGYVFSADAPYTGIDFDDCFDSEGVLYGDVDVLLATLDSYAEVSPSRTGVKTIVRATKNGFSRRSTSATSWGGKFEVYDQKRFFTITGEALNGNAPIGDRQEELDTVLEIIFTAEEPEVTKPVATSPGLNDRELLVKASRAKDGADFERLWAGEILDGKSHSEADIALCGKLAFWTNGDSSEVDRLFRSSGLMRDKWDERRNDSTYGADTIVKAIASRNGFYDSAHSTETKADAEGSDDPGYRRLSGFDMRSIKFLDKPLFQQSAFQLIAGKKGSGKGTYIALIAKKTTRGELFGRPMNVLIVSSEDSASIDIRPRVEAAGGDSERVYIVTRPFLLPRDLDWLKQAAL
jgi:putative DNA primase/helicase